MSYQHSQNDEMIELHNGWKVNASISLSKYIMIHIVCAIIALICTAHLIYTETKVNNNPQKSISEKYTEECSPNEEEHEVTQNTTSDKVHQKERTKEIVFIVFWFVIAALMGRICWHYKLTEEMQYFEK